MGRSCSPYSTKSTYARGDLKFRIPEAKMWMLWAEYNLSNEKGVGWRDGFELIILSSDDILSSDVHWKMSGWIRLRNTFEFLTSTTS